MIKMMSMLTCSNTNGTSTVHWEHVWDTKHWKLSTNITIILNSIVFFWTLVKIFNYQSKSFSFYYSENKVNEANNKKVNLPEAKRLHRRGKELPEELF